MNHAFKNIVAVFTVLIFLTSTLGFVIVQSYCSCSEKASISLDAFSTNDKCNLCVDEHHQESCCTEENEVCSFSDHQSCCTKTIKYLKSDSDYLSSQTLEVIKPFASVISICNLLITNDDSDIFQKTIKRIDFPILLRKILIFYYHHNKIIPDNIY
ncbi:MAG: hypothetical protein U9R42_11260 [Bacteroidota bacterium]|nr:hypothetical protein [Bacteroidota bacterium]